MKRLVPDSVVLGLLKLQPAHGYELLTFFRSDSELGRIWTMSTSQLYAVLKRLEEEGSIIGEQVEVSDAPPRVIYSLTNSGEEQFMAWLYENKPSVSIHKIRVMFLSRLYIALLLHLPFEEIIEYQMSVLENQHTILLTEKQKSLSTIENLAVEFMLSQIESALSWLQDCQVELER